MTSDGDHNDAEAASLRPAASKSDPSLHSRRAVVRNGVKLAFTAPVISTFFASQAYATNYSCYPEGHGCDAASETKRQQCCDALTCDGNPGTCQP